MKIVSKLDLSNIPDLTEERIVEQLLESRAIEDKATFLAPPDPFSLSIADFGFSEEIEQTVSLLTEIKKKKQKIVVYTDYDADGITGGTILWETLHLLGFDVMPYVPHRKHEGYGFSQKGIDTVKKEFDPALIISVDHGITAREKIAYAKSIGIDVIVTDHHLAPEILPDQAQAIFHIPALSGSGVAYFFSKMVFEKFGDPHSPQYEKLKQNFGCDYTAIASIGTIADLVPLLGASRSLVTFGLQAFNTLKRPGLTALLKDAGIEGKPITPFEVGFMIAPRINAVGRLEHALDALRLLCTTSEDRAQQLAAKIGEQNSLRQDLVKEAVIEAKGAVEAKKSQGELPHILILKSDSWHEGIMGLIASKLVEAYARPVIIMTKNDGYYKGSARSISTFHITNFLRSLQKEYLIDAGGHKQAAGFSIHEDNVAAFIQAVEQQGNLLLKTADLIPQMETDIHIPLNVISKKIVSGIQVLQPFGIGNPQPVFSSEAVITDAKLFGKKNDHLRIFFQTPGNTLRSPLECIAFGKADLFYTLPKGQTITIAYQPEINTWNGREKVQARFLALMAQDD
ncbi:single-stranded-DNA-specific exonuclease RecJ [Candidatus Roizmanbacteria bacterium]|nr:single-stranded-DNA-specific exonuclease RecJ [Candidatus Roizmanbacteria bacterium]